MSKPNLVDFNEPCLLVRIPKLWRADMSPGELYDATRGVWRLGERRNAVRFVLAVHNGVVWEAFEVSRWFPAGTTEYRDRASFDIDIEGRWEFTGQLASTSIRGLVIGGSVAGLFARGNSNPVKYLNC
ncbi:hypothetical protein BH11ARM1_BH11ARM1_11190 [soil metagenome]